MRELREVAVVPGPAGVRALTDALRDALDGGPAVAPVPVDPPDGSGPATYSERVRAALRPDDAAAPLERADVVAVVATSGSTGEPRGVLLTDGGIRAATAALHDLLGGPGDWVAALPVHSAGGLMVLARAVLGGTRVHPDPSVGGGARFDPLVFAATVAAARTGGAARLYASLVPTQLQRVIDAGEPGLDALRALDAVLSGAAATPPGLLQQLRDNGIRVLASYGMSETGGGCAYDGVPLPGLTIRTDAAGGSELGRLVVSGPTVAAGYRLRPDDPALQGGTVVTNDLGTVAADGTVTVVGRVDDVVQVGGVNVALPAVADVLRSHPQVADACVLSVPDRQWGARIVAFVVGVPEAAAVLAELLESVRHQLGAAAMPRQVVPLDAIPALPSGKPDRLALLARLPT